MPATETEERIERIRERIRHSRQEIFGLAHALRGDDDRFPRSRLMRVLTGSAGRVLGSAALAATALQPTLWLRTARFAGLLRPMLRYLLPRLLR